MSTSYLHVLCCEIVKTALVHTYTHTEYASRLSRLKHLVHAYKRFPLEPSLPSYVSVSAYVLKHTMAKYIVICTVDNYVYIPGQKPKTVCNELL